MPEGRRNCIDNPETRHFAAIEFMMGGNVGRDAIVRFEGTYSRA
jgi:hypothetical protein